MASIFVAGATGATGRVFLPLATAEGHTLTFHVRPKTAATSPLAKDPRARVFELDDAPALGAALRGQDVVVSFVGTMQKRFGAGDTYESSDVGSTTSLVAAAKAAGVPRFLLLSSYGAGGMGAYLAMKRRCERIVEESGLAWTLFRPSALVSPEGDAGDHLGRRDPPPMMGAVLGALRGIGPLRGWADDVRPIPIEILARAFVRVVESPENGRILQGRDLWKLGGT
ncbi:MAG: NAD(P)-binding oxidoreductase [Polyangiaceae bacterium]